MSQFKRAVKMNIFQSTQNCMVNQTIFQQDVCKAKFQKLILKINILFHRNTVLYTSVIAAFILTPGCIHLHQLSSSYTQSSCKLPSLLMKFRHTVTSPPRIHVARNFKIKKVKQLLVVWRWLLSCFQKLFDDVQEVLALHFSGEDLPYSEDQRKARHTN